MTNARALLKLQGYRPTSYALSQSVISRSESDIRVTRSDRCVYMLCVCCKGVSLLLLAPLTFYDVCGH